MEWIMPQPAFSDYAALDAHLDSLGLFRMRPGLERMQTVLNRLGLTRPPFTLVQIVGTNGKGSTAAMLAALAEEHGLITGLHTSPHFVSVRERVRVNGKELGPDAWTALGNKLMTRGGEELTYFEFVTCLAVLAFAEAGVQLAVMESGLGGAFDATTALDADLVVYTPIGLDHQAVLGQSLAEIARDKAGAMRPGGAAITGPQQADALRELQKTAKERKVRLHLPEEKRPLPGGLRLRLAGPHQRDNARLALAAWRLLSGQGLLPEAIGKALFLLNAGSTETREVAALGRAGLPGRLQQVPAGNGYGPFAACPLGRPPLLLDGAHNGQGLAALGKALALEGIAPGAVVFACLADKDLDTMLPHLRTLATGPIFVPPVAGNPRACPPEDLARQIGLNAVPCPDLPQALALAAAHMAERHAEAFTESPPLHPLLICGSLYLLGEFYALQPDCLEKGW